MRRKLSAVVVVALVGVVGYAAQPSGTVRAEAEVRPSVKPWLISGDWAPVQAVLDERAAQEAAEAVRVAEEGAAAEEARQTALRAAQQAVPRPVVSQPQSQACADLAGTVSAVFGDQAGRALDIARRESGCTDTARNSSGASGVFQIMMPLHEALVIQICGSAARVFEPACNTAVAWALSNGGTNFAPWNASGG